MHLNIKYELWFPVGIVTLVCQCLWKGRWECHWSALLQLDLCPFINGFQSYLPTYVIGIWFLQPKILLGVYSKLNGSDVYKHLKYFLDCLQLELVCFVVGDKIRNWSKTDQWPVCYRIGSPICRNIKIQKWNWDLWTGHCISHQLWLCLPNHKR